MALHLKHFAYSHQGTEVELSQPAKAAPMTLTLNAGGRITLSSGGISRQLPGGERGWVSWATIASLIEQDGLRDKAPTERKARF